MNMPMRRAGFEPDVRTRMQRQIRVCEAVRTVYPTIPVSYVQLFLAVAVEPGLGSSEYARRVGMTQGAASRILLELGPKTRTGETGFQLLEIVPDAQDLRVKRLYLTTRGEALIRNIDGAIQGDMR